MARLCWSPKAHPWAPQKYVNGNTTHTTIQDSKMVLTAEERGVGEYGILMDSGIHYFWENHSKWLIVDICWLYWPCLRAAFFKLLWWRPCQRELQRLRPSLIWYHHGISIQWAYIVQTLSRSEHILVVKIYARAICCRTVASQISGVSRKAE